MKKHLLTLLMLIPCTLVWAQTESEAFVSIDFVEVIDNQVEETLYYYENNWLVLRKQAIKDKAIADYELLFSPAKEDTPAIIVLSTTYANKTQYDHREDYFGKLIEVRGPRNLLNEKQPKEFRKFLAGSDNLKKLFGN